MFLKTLTEKVRFLTPDHKPRLNLKNVITKKNELNIVYVKAYEHQDADSRRQPSQTAILLDRIVIIIY